MSEASLYSARPWGEAPKSRRQTTLLAALACGLAADLLTSCANSSTPDQTHARVYSVDAAGTTSSPNTIKEIQSGEYLITGFYSDSHKYFKEDVECRGKTLYIVGYDSPENTGYNSNDPLSACKDGRLTAREAVEITHPVGPVLHI